MYARLTEGDLRELRAIRTVNWVFFWLNLAGFLCALTFLLLQEALNSLNKQYGTGTGGVNEFTYTYISVMAAILPLMAILHAFVAKKLKKLEGRIPAIIVAVLCLLSPPLGTVIGVWMLVVLAQPRIRDNVSPW